MSNNLIHHISKTVQLSPQEVDFICSVIKPLQLKKRDFLLQEGQVCKFISYVDSGCLRVYSIDDNGFENNVFFTIDDWWALDLKSFIEQAPARFFIDALEACQLLQISKSDFDWLLLKIPKLERWFRILLQNALISSENRIDHKASLKAEERYIRFIEKYPSLETRIPQKHIASYLGISPEFLSTLKAKRLNRKKP